MITLTTPLLPQTLEELEREKRQLARTFMGRKIVVNIVEPFCCPLVWVAFCFCSGKTCEFVLDNLSGFCDQKYEMAVEKPAKNWSDLTFKCFALYPCCIRAICRCSFQNVQDPAICYALPPERQRMQSLEEEIVRALLSQAINRDPASLVYAYWDP